MAGAQTASPSETIGRTLKALREAQNLTLADIAARLHLDPRVIAAIEADNHDALPAALYVRGYLRGYARIVGANPEQVVGVYNEQAPSAPPEIIPEINRPLQLTSEDTPVRIATVAVALLLTALLAIWWEANYRARPRPAPAPAPTAAGVPDPKTQLPLSQLDYSYAVVTHPATAYFPGAEAPGTGDPGAGMIGDTATPPGSPLPPGTGQIMFRATTESWLEVTDGSGERIYMDFVHGGESVTLTGQAPFEVLLGYAPGVTVEFQGRIIDTERFTRAGVARFSLGR